jgi:hypothetical protein
MSDGLVRAILGGLIGATLLGYIGLKLGIRFFCAAFPESNLCGLGGYFVGLPVGVLLGGVLGVLLARLIRRG